MTRRMITRVYGERGWLFTGRFWVDALERAVRAAAGAALLILGAGAAGEAGDLDPAIVGVLANLGAWRVALTVAAGAFVLSLLTSIAAGLVGERGTAAFVPPDR